MVISWPAVWLITLVLGLFAWLLGVGSIVALSRVGVNTLDPRRLPWAFHFASFCVGLTLPVAGLALVRTGGHSLMGLVLLSLLAMSLCLRASAKSSTVLNPGWFWSQLGFFLRVWAGVSAVYMLVVTAANTFWHSPIELWGSALPLKLPYIDSLLYARIPASWREVPIENPFNGLNAFDTVYQVHSLYHFTELWVCYAVLVTTGLSPIVALVFVTQVLLAFGVALGVAAVIERGASWAQPAGHQMAALPQILVVAFAMVAALLPSWAPPVIADHRWLYPLTSVRGWTPLVYECNKLLPALLAVLCSVLLAAYGKWRACIASLAIWPVASQLLGLYLPLVLALYVAGAFMRLGNTQLSLRQRLRVRCLEVLLVTAVVALGFFVWARVSPENAAVQAPHSQVSSIAALVKDFSLRDFFRFELIIGLRTFVAYSWLLVPVGLLMLAGPSARKLGLSLVGLLIVITAYYALVEDRFRLIHSEWYQVFYFGVPISFTIAAALAVGWLTHTRPVLQKLIQAWLLASCVFGTVSLGSFLNEIRAFDMKRSHDPAYLLTQATRPLPTSRIGYLITQVEFEAELNYSQPEAAFILGGLVYADGMGQAFSMSSNPATPFNLSYLQYPHHELRERYPRLSINRDPLAGADVRNRSGQPVGLEPFKRYVWVHSKQTPEANLDSLRVAFARNYQLSAIVCSAHSVLPQGFRAYVTDSIRDARSGERTYFLRLP